MRVLNKNMAYHAPQSELIEIQVESNFMGGSSTTSFSASFKFEDGDKGRVEEGSELL